MNAFTEAFALGSQVGSRIRERRADNALAGYVSSLPQNGIVATPEQQAATQQAYANLAKYNPQGALQVRAWEQQNEARAAQAQAQQIQKRRADLPFLGRLLNSVTDENSYQRARGIAQEYGVDLAGAPPQYDPNWLNQQKVTVQALSTPQGQEALSTAGKQAQDEGLNPGSPEFSRRVTEIWQANNAKPYTDSNGATRLYVPGAQSQPSNGGIPQDAINALRSGQGSAQQFDEIFGAGAAQRVLGGGSSNAAGGF